MPVRFPVKMYATLFLTDYGALPGLTDGKLIIDM